MQPRLPSEHDTDRAPAEISGRGDGAKPCCGDCSKKGCGNVRHADWKDFRDHIATAEQNGKRRWLYPKTVKGRFYRARTYVSWLLLAVLFAGPFIRIQGNPLLMINIVERRYSILGHIFWPQDVAIFAVAMLVFLTSIIIFTAAFGRLWCGWVCPQTLLMEMVFRKIERVIEGDSHAQRALASAPWTGRKIFKKTAKQLVFFGLSFIIGNTLLSYIIGSGQLLDIITDNPLKHLGGLGFMMLFTLVFYAIFARFREQACTFICPYGRFQSTILDENTVVVAYDYKRGEPRGRWSGTRGALARAQHGLGDCVDCNQCVAVCPTGIDIRDGTQMECVNCTACIDACDAVMEKLRLPRGLIRYASLNSIERGERFKITPRMIGYAIVLGALISVFGVLLFTRSEVELTLLRAPGALFEQLPNGDIENIYTLKLVNKTMRDLPLELRLENPGGKLTVMGEGLIVPKAQIATGSVLIEMQPSALHGHRAKLSVGVYSAGKRLYSVNTVFIGPHE